MKHCIALAFAACTLGLAGTQASASVIGDYITGEFVDPILMGCIEDAATLAPTCMDDTSTAVYSINNATPSGGPLKTSSIMWGDYPGGPAGNIPFSTIAFTGGFIPPTGGVLPFSIGAISYTNGTSETTSDVFGATLNLYASNGRSTVFIGSELVAFNATLNDGTDAQDADYLTFSGLPGESFNVFEGGTLHGHLNGKVIGDPNAVLTGLSLSGGQSANGFIGNDPTFAVPEPTTLGLLGLTFAGIGVGFAARRKMSWMSSAR
jgi:hypothetical protein